MVICKLYVVEKVVLGCKQVGNHCSLEFNEGDFREGLKVNKDKTKEKVTYYFMFVDGNLVGC